MAVTQYKTNILYIYMYPSLHCVCLSVPIPGADDGNRDQRDDADSAHQRAGDQGELLSQLRLVLIWKQTHDSSVQRYCRHCSKPSATHTHPAEHLREGKIRARQCCFFCFFFVPPVAHEVTFVRLILRRNSGPHTGSQSRAEFNYFTARFSLLLSLSNSCTLFPLHCRNSSRPLAPAQSKISKKKKTTHLPSVRVWKSMSLL